MTEDSIQTPSNIFKENGNILKENVIINALYGFSFDADDNIFSQWTIRKNNCYKEK